MSFIYLASPYSHLEEEVRVRRFDQACEKAAQLMNEGHAVFSPIAHSHTVARFLHEDLLLSHDFWMAQDLPVLEKASLLVILTLDGWEHSRGVAEERRHAIKHQIPIEYHEA